MTDLDDSSRVRAASRLRDLGHEFVARDLNDTDLATINDQITALLALVRAAPPRTRAVGGFSMDEFRARVPVHGEGERQYLFADAVVAGGANPMGLGAYLWRDGEFAVMEVTLGRAFEGAPDRAHGGIVAALLDETLGLALSINGLLALTAQLDITYLAATPINAPLLVRAWLESRDGRKLSMRAVLSSDGTPLVEAAALFIAIDPANFRPSI